MRLSIVHQTRYLFDEPAIYTLQQLRLTPKSRANQRVVDWRIEIVGGKQEAAFEDQHANKVSLISVDPGVSEIDIACEGVVETIDRAGVVGEAGGFAPLWYFRRETELTKSGPLSRKFAQKMARRFAKGEKGDVGQLHELSAEIAKAIDYEIGRTHVATSTEAAFAEGKGVCQDHAHAFVTCARILDWPARYVSGYLLLDDRTHQAAAHAWAEAYVDGLGWVGFDVSNGVSPDDRYVRVATGLDYGEAAPISGMRYGEGNERMVVSLQVQQ